MRLPARFALFRDYRVEGLCVLQTHCYFTEDSHEYGVILGGFIVQRLLTFQVAVRPLAELACRTLVRSQ